MVSEGLLSVAISIPGFYPKRGPMTTLASILLAFAIGALVAVKLCVWAVIGFCKLVVRWVERAV